jgi:hypothetical protein
LGREAVGAALLTAVRPAIARVEKRILLEEVVFAEPLDKTSSRWEDAQSYNVLCSHSCTTRVDLQRHPLELSKLSADGIVECRTHDTAWNLSLAVRFDKEGGNTMLVVYWMESLSFLHH